MVNHPQHIVSAIGRYFFLKLPVFVQSLRYFLTVSVEHLDSLYQTWIHPQPLKQTLPPTQTKNMKSTIALASPVAKLRVREKRIAAYVLMMMKRRGNQSL